MPEVLPNHKGLKEWVSALAPNLRVEVKESQISFKGKRLAMATCLPIRKVKARP
jgi:hypothetical protein